MPELPVLQGPRDRGCTLCSLHEGAGANRCIPLTLHALTPFRNPPLPPLLVVGMNPGREEQQADRPFVGPSGKLLDRTYIGASGLSSLCTVWLTNASRCWTPLTQQPKVSHRTKCSSRWIPEDLSFILDHHPNQPQIDVLCLGADASDAVIRLVRKVDRAFSKGTSPLTFLIKNQGTVTPPLPTARHDPIPLRLWATYHPAYLIREGGVQAPTVSAHLSLIVHALAGTAIPASAPLVVPPFDPTPLT